MIEEVRTSKNKYVPVCLFILVLLLSFFTYFRSYSQPQSLFWDENYHIASAQKYLNKVFFMEPHPPLGKLLIALGEVIFDTNQDDAVFKATDQAKSPPEGFSFSGYRFFPVLFAWAAAPLFFLILFYLTGKPLVSFLISLCYIFDNAIIVHSRGAMLEGIQIFFLLLTIFCVIVLYRRLQNYLWVGGVPYFCGVAFAAAITTKATSLIVLPFFLVLVPVLRGQSRLAVKVLLQIGSATVLTYFIVWQIHFALGRKVEPLLPNQGFYQASEATKTIIKEGISSNPLNFTTLLRDSLHFFTHYERGVPKMNLCNNLENGSLPYLWPLGARSISYRWDKEGDAVRYTYLQINPVVWLIGLLGLIFSAAFLLVWLAGRIELDHEWLLFTGVFFMLWLGYMAVMVSLDRVMYLYHYFIPLLFSLILAAMVSRKFDFSIIFPRLRLSDENLKRMVIIFSASFALCIFAAFRFYSPLTYGEPLTNQELASRNVLSLWDLHCSDCKLTNHFAQPVCDPKDKISPRIQIGSVYAQNSYQEWGDPKQGLTVEDTPIIIAGKTYKDGIGTHAYSVLRFPLSKKYLHFSGKVALPDYLKNKDGDTSSVIFEVWLDNTQIWRSRLLNPNDQLEEFSLSVVDGQLLELRALDGGNGNGNDHAVWVDLSLS
jgi:dolichyl-phosphate-mannose-protein mannosyltransferase